MSNSLKPLHSLSYQGIPLVENNFAVDLIGNFHLDNIDYKAICNLDSI